MEDRYEIIDVVARGAMATVWRARDVRLGRLVAIKRPHATPETDPAFTATARSAAAVTHPNLVTIFDTGTDDTGPYLVMEFVDGPTLAEMGGVSGGAAALCSEIASGLTALHAAGIVHRDVRPSNILLGPTGSKLTDFGTARTLDAATRSNVATPGFEAPEVLAGAEPDKPSDVYSLGAVLSWLTSQNPPGPELASIIDQAMSQDPGARPTAATLADRLRRMARPATTALGTAAAVAAAPEDDATRHFDAAPVPPDPIEPEQETSRRRRRIAALVALGLVALVTAAVALGGDDDPDAIAGDTTIANVDTTTTTPPPTTAAPEPTVEEESGGVFETVRIFVTFIREAPRDVVTNSGAEEIVSNVVDGVSEAIRGNDDEAESNLADAVETVQEEVDSESVIDRAIELIIRLARQLGLDEEQVAPSG